MSNEPIRHHYVPIFYPLGFAQQGDERLWLYDRKTQRWTKPHPKNICCEKELYTLDPLGKQIRLIEKKWLGQIDGDAASGIRLLRNREQLSDEAKEWLSVFMAQQITRTPGFRKLITESYRAMLEEFMRIGFSDVTRARTLMERYTTETGDQLDGQTPESMVEAVLSGGITVSVNEGAFLQQMIGQVEFLAHVMMSFDWQILTANDETG